MLEAEVVLIRVGGMKMRIHYVNGVAIVERKKARCCKVEVSRRRLRRKWINTAFCRQPGIGKVGNMAGTWPHGWLVIAAIGRCLAIERRSAIKLQIVLALQLVVEDPKAPAHARFAVARSPRKSNSRRKIILIRKINASRSAFIARENQPHRSVGKSGRLEPRNDRECPARGVEFGRVVFIA